MKIQLFSIFDFKLGEFNTPMAFQSRGVAVRSFSDEVKRADENNQLYKHPEDFVLYIVGQFDSETGLFNGSDIPLEVVVRGADLAS